MASLVLSSVDYIRGRTEKSNLMYNVKRAILPIILATLVLSGLLFSSTVAYFIFYWSYIPSVGIARDVHLQFSQNVPPWGTIDLAGTNMLSGQPYAAFVELELPRTRNNLEIGNFMVTLTILNPSNDTLSTSSRPAILTYTSPIITTSLTLLNSPLFITGFKKESETLLVPVMERFEFSSYRSTRPTTAYIEITPEGNKIQVYSTKLIFVAQFEGVRWFMYSHRIIAFALFTSLFFISSSLFAGLTWFIFSLRASHTHLATDDLRDGSISTITPGEKRPPSQSESQLDDDATMSPSIISRTRFTPHRSSSSTSYTYPPFTELSSREEYRQSQKPRFSSDSSPSVRGREDEISSSVSQTRTDDDQTSADGQDDDMETIERHPISEVSF